MRSSRIIRAVSIFSVLLAMVSVVASTSVQAQDPPSDEPVFVTASVDDDMPFIGQQITYVAKIYRRSGFNHPIRYEPPDFAGFWNVRLTDQIDYTETVGSDEFEVVELRTPLFPSVVGAVPIRSARVTVSSGANDDPILVESSPIMIEALPTPTEAPEEFSGAVGKFEIFAEVDATTVPMNESVQMSVSIQGEGNVDALPDPKWPAFEGWRVIDSPVSVSIDVVDGRIVGSREYVRDLVPEMAGELTVPELSYTYFDPESENYVRAVTSPIAVTITPIDGTLSSNPTSQSSDAEDVTGPRTIKDVPSSLQKSEEELTNNWIYWLAWVFPLLVIIGAAAWRRSRDARQAALAGARRRNALPNARSSLGRAVAAGEDRAVASADAVMSYLNDRLGSPVSGLTREALGKQLLDVGVASELAERVEETLELGEAARYAPGLSHAGAPNEDTERATRLLIELDGALDP